MAKQITLDSLRPGGINIFKGEGQLRVEANYQILSADEVTKTISRDITQYLSPTTKTTLSNAYITAFNKIEQVELP